MSLKAVHLRSSSDYVRPPVIAKNIRVTREQAGAFVRGTRKIFKPFAYEPAGLPEVVRAFVLLKDIAIGGPRVLENRFYPVPEWLCKRSADAVQLHGDISAACEKLGRALQKKGWLSLADKAIRENIERAVEVLRTVESDDQLFYNPQLIKTFCLRHNVTLSQFLEASNRAGKSISLRAFEFSPVKSHYAVGSNRSPIGRSIFGAPQFNEISRDLVRKGSQKPRILLVDPERSQAEVTKFLLENEYFKVDLALTAKEATDLFLPGKYRGLICDMELKETEPMYGVYLINDLRKQDPNLAVIAQSENFPMMQVKALKDMNVEIYTKSEKSKEVGGVVDLVKKLIPIPADLKPDAGEEVSRGGVGNGISHILDGFTGDQV